MITYLLDYERVLVKYQKDDTVEAEPKLTQLRNMGASGQRYFMDGKNFYKQPRQDNVEDFTAHLHSEPAATQAMHFMHAGDMVPLSEHAIVKGVSYLKTPLLHSPVKLYTHLYNESLPASSIPTNKQLSRFALASWVIHAVDRNDENYLTHEDHSTESPIIKAIDFSEAFHPNMGFGEKHKRMMHCTADALLTHLIGEDSLPLDKEQLSHILSNKKTLLDFAKEGTKGLKPSQRKDAKSLMQEKFKHLQSMMLEDSPTIHDLPYYEGFNYVE